MSELLPCPFCGGEASMVWMPYIGGGGYGHVVECDECWAKSAFFSNEAEAIEAWNTRADDYRQAAEYWQRMYEKAFAERTCHEFGSVRVWQSCNVWSHELSCGHEIDTLDSEPPNYCPNCGARVTPKNSETTSKVVSE